MTRYALASVLVLSGCAANSSYNPQYTSTTNTKASVDEVLGVVALFAVGGLAYGIYLAIPRPAPKAPPPRRLPDSIWGKVVWADSGKPVPPVALTLKGDQGVIARTTSDGDGNFRFPAPIPDAALTVTIEDGRAEGYNAASLLDITIVEAQPKRTPPAPPLVK